jgi:hypothetical protein
MGDIGGTTSIFWDRKGGTMKKALLIITVLILGISPAWGMKATTTNNCIACFTEESINDIVSFVASGDRTNFDAYVKMQKCIILKGGVDVTVTKSPGMFGGNTQFVIRGIKLWSTSGGLTDYRVE